MIISLFELMKISLDVPDYTRIARRAKTVELSDLNNIDSNEHIHILIDSTGLKIFGQGQWHEEKHGLKKRREWRKLHLVIDRESHAILTQELTPYNQTDASQVAPLLENIEETVLSVSADGAYDSEQVYQAIADNSSDNAVITIPPRKEAALSENYKTFPNARDNNILFVENYGKYRWQDYSDYGYRSLVETAMFRYKTLIGDTMYARELSTQKVEAKIACLALNKMTKMGMPESIKIKSAA